MMGPSGIKALAMALVMAMGAAVLADGAKVGQAAPDFELKNVADGKAVKLSDVQGIVVLVWQSTTCPWNYMRDSAGYERVLAPLAKEYEGKGVTFLAINSNKNEPLDELKGYVTKNSLPYPILKDPGNKVADAYGAKTTPHVFVRDAKGVLVYKGGIEKAPTSPDKCGQSSDQYLAPVLNAALAGETLPYTETVSKGCSVKRE